MTTLDKAASYNFPHPEFNYRPHCRIDTVSECGRYVKVIITGFDEDVWNEADKAQCEILEAAIGQDWNVAVSDLHRLIGY